MSSCRQDTGLNYSAAFVYLIVRASCGVSSLHISPSFYSQQITCSIKAINASYHDRKPYTTGQDLFQNRVVCNAAMHHLSKAFVDFVTLIMYYYITNLKSTLKLLTRSMGLCCRLI
jgi:hypothetical protein